MQVVAVVVVFVVVVVMIATSTGSRSLLDVSSSSSAEAGRLAAGRLTGWDSTSDRLWVGSSGSSEGVSTYSAMRSLRFFGWSSSSCSVDDTPRSAFVCNYVYDIDNDYDYDDDDYDAVSYTHLTLPTKREV